MKKLKNTLILSGLLLLIGNNSYAATETTGTMGYTKFIAIGIAALIIILLLFLGYKMDSKEDTNNYHVKKTKKKENKPVVEDTKYEPDTVSYEKDNVDVDDYLEKTEYDEDEEESLFGSMSDELEKDNEYSPEEEYGEEFDTSIIDNIEDEEDIEVPKKSMDETMVFDKPPVAETTDIENEIDELDNLEIEEKLEETDPLMEELNKIDKTESSFKGFSVDSEEKTDVKPHKKYTKSKKSESSAESDFLAQMEETMKKDKEERDAKKTTKKKK